MSDTRGKVEATVLFDKDTCFFMRNGRCSLDLVDDVSISSAVKIAPNEALYCPRLLKSLRTQKRAKTVKIVPCRCGHVEVVSSQQLACIASHEGTRVTLVTDGEEMRDLCPICGRQITFDEEEAIRNGGMRILTLRVSVPGEKDDPEE